MQVKTISMGVVPQPDSSDMPGPEVDSVTIPGPRGLVWDGVGLRGYWDMTPPVPTCAAPLSGDSAALIGLQPFPTISGQSVSATGGNNYFASTNYLAPYPAFSDVRAFEIVVDQMDSGALISTGVVCITDFSKSVLVAYLPTYNGGSWLFQVNSNTVGDFVGTGQERAGIKIDGASGDCWFYIDGVQRGTGSGADTTDVVLAIAWNGSSSSGTDVFSGQIITDFAALAHDYGCLDWCGNASAGGGAVLPAAARDGDIYEVSVAGTYQGVSFLVGDLAVVRIDGTSVTRIGAGPTGATGPQGPQGNTGPTGATGTNAANIYTSISSTQDWTIGANTQFVRVIAKGAGGGGGSGAVGAAGTLTIGGGGGGGGSCTDVFFSRAEILAAYPSGTLTVTVGAGGLGGNAVVTNSTAGNNGSLGGNTTFGNLVTGFGGGGGGGGNLTSSIVAGGSGASARSAGTTASTSTANGTGAGGGASAVPFNSAPYSGSGGGGATTGGTATATTGSASGGVGGGAGGGVNGSNTNIGGYYGGPRYRETLGAAPASSTGASTVNGSNGGPPLYGCPAGGGGGGGGCGISANAGAGGTGGIASGGGGGGGARNGYSSGAGGLGGAGECIIMEW